MVNTSDPVLVELQTPYGVVAGMLIHDGEAVTRDAIVFAELVDWFASRNITATSGYQT